MSLIVLQLSTGDETTDSSIQETLCELLTTLRAAGEWLPQDRRVQEPVVVVPEDDRPWRGDDPRPFVDSGHAVLPQGDAAALGADVRIGGALHRAFNRALDHRALLERPSGRGASEPPAIVVVPVLVIADEDLEPEEVIERLAEVERVNRWLDRAAAVISLGGLARQTDQQLDLGVTVAPWVFLPHPPHPARFPPGLFAGSVGIGTQHAMPLVYTGTAADGRRRTWAEYGRQRLLTDLYFLHGLSGSLSEVARLFPPRIDEGARRLYTLHSALFEYPLDELLSEARLASLLVKDGDRSPVLPDPQNLDDLAEAAQTRVAAPLGLLGAKVVHLLDSGIHSDEFAFKATWKHLPDPQFSPLGPAEHRWQTWFDDKRWPMVGPERRADTLHTQVVQALRRCAREALDDRLDEALVQARVETAALLKAAESELSTALTASNWADDGGKSGRTATALGCALALLDGLARCAAKGAEEPEAPPGVEEVLEKLEGAREVWLADEASLMERGGTQPSLGGFWAELGCVALAVAGAAASASFFAPLFLLAGAALAFLLYRRRIRQLGEYWDSWKDLETRYLTRANAAAEALVAPLGHRVRQVKALALQDMLRALQVAERRFRVEVRGLVDMVKAEQALLARKHRRTVDEERAAARGLFRFLPEVRVETINAESLQVFHDGLARLLTQALRLTTVPGRVAIGEYEQLIARLVAQRDEQRVQRAHAEQACTWLGRCVRSGVNPEEVSDVGVLPPAADPVTYAMIGRSLTGRLGTGLHRALGTASISWSRCFASSTAPAQTGAQQLQVEAVLRAFAPEIAVVTRISAWTVRPAAVAEVRHG